MKKLLSLFFVLLFFIPGVLGVTDHTVRGDLQNFGYAIKSLVPPGTSMTGFIDGMLGSMPLFGLIVIVFGLMFFITKISIFKSPEHDKYARMISFGVALIGLAQQSVYNVILGWSTTFLILSFILAIIFMFIMFVNHSRKLHLTSHAELHNITKNALSARSDLEKVKHELKHEKSLYNKTDKDLSNLDDELGSISHLVGDELTQIDKIAALLRKASSAYSTSGEGSSAVGKFVTSLADDLAGLITTMKHEQKHNIHLNSLVSKIETELARWGHVDDKSKSEEDHLRMLFNKLFQTWGHNISGSELNHLYQDKNSLIKQLKVIRNHLHELQRLYDKIMSEEEELDKSNYQRKHLEANAVRDNIMNQQFTEAHKHLDNLRAIVEYEPHLIHKLKKHSQEMHRLLSNIDSEENSVNALIKNKLLKALTLYRKSSTPSSKSNP